MHVMFLYGPWEELIAEFANHYIIKMQTRRDRQVRRDVLRCTGATAIFVLVPPAVPAVSSHLSFFWQKTKQTLQK